MTNGIAHIQYVLFVSNLIFGLLVFGVALRFVFVFERKPAQNFTLALQLSAAVRECAPVKVTVLTRTPS